MPGLVRLRAAVWMIALVVAAAGCVHQGKPKPAPTIDEPVDAFQAAGAPADAQPADAGPVAGPSGENLSSDIQRLQDARQVYRHAQQRQRAEAVHDQAACRAAPGSRTIRIRDGASGGVYCQRDPEAR